MESVATTIHAKASINVRSIVLPRATWDTGICSDGLPTFSPKKGTWHAHVVRTRSGIIVLPMIGCPACGGILTLTPDKEAAKLLRLWTGLPVPVAHAIDRYGKVSPDVLCKHGSCDFHRRVYLDRWSKTKPLFALAYVNLDKGEHGEIEIAYSHAIDAKEARMHLGVGNFRTIAAGPAVGFFVDEKTGRVTAD